MRQKDNSEKKKWYEKKRHWWQIAVFDLLLAVLVFGIFSVFHVFIPRYNAKRAGVPEPQCDLNALAAEQGGSEAENEAEAETEKMDESTWRGRFFEHFSQEVEIGDNYYKSPNVSVEISEYHDIDQAGEPVVSYIADIYVADVKNFGSCFAEINGNENAEVLAERNNAILAVNGDYCTYQNVKFYVRNGLVYDTLKDVSDICVLYNDGVMETYGPDEYEVDEILEKMPYHVWKFGPQLLNKDGSPSTEFNSTPNIIWHNPRTGLGYYEPGHYCFVVVDGRQDGYSAGYDLEHFAKLFYDLGCKRAYNMDGGASSCMVFMGRTINSPSNGGRDLSDMLIIREPEEEKGDEKHEIH